MFKWPGSPSAKADEHELADFVELVSWRDGSMSAVDLARHLGRVDEVDYSDGVQEEEEEGVDVLAESVFAELEHRANACLHGYPFSIGNSGQSVRFIGDDTGDVRHAIYAFLLLATRLNMNIDRVQDGINGTVIFEKLAAEAARIYLGERSKSFVFGTSAQGVSFKEKVNDLCTRIGEGDGFSNRGGDGRRQKDGKLDLVAWTPFSDRLPSKLLVFGQCKTGTHFKEQLAQLQPDTFCSNWFRSQPAVMPVRAFFVAEALPRSVWRNSAVEGGLLFDRCRIVDFINGASDDVLNKVQTWTAAAWARHR